MTFVISREKILGVKLMGQVCKRHRSLRVVTSNGNSTLLRALFCICKYCDLVCDYLDLPVFETPVF